MHNILADISLSTYWLTLGLCVLGASILVVIFCLKLNSKKQKIEELNHVFNKRTLDINKTTDKLEALVKKAENSSAAKSYFLASMSHEIRTPLNGIIGMTSLLKEMNIGKDQNEMVNVISRSGTTLLNLINDILDFSKIEAQGIELESIPISLSVLLDETLDIISEKARRKDLDVLFHIKEGTPNHFLGDPVRIRQIILNLVDNAIKFTETGEVEVSVSFFKKDSKDNLLITVRDTGIGINKDRHKRLFISFSQEDSSSTRRFGGTGLGLTISKKLTELMGGVLSFKSEQKKGTSFFFSLPIKTIGSVEPETLVEPKYLAGRKILLLENNNLIRNVVSNWLIETGVQITSMNSGKEAMRRIHAGDTYDCIIIDFNLEYSNPDQLARTLRLNHKSSLPVFIGLSNAMQKPDPTLFTQIINKPLKRLNLIESLDTIFSKTTLAKTSPFQDLLNRGNTKPSDQHPMKILVVDDNRINLQLATRMLAKMGYTVDTAINGKDALNKCMKKHYDTIFMDIQMPVMDGLEATKAIHQHYHNSTPPWIIALTARVMRSDRDEILSSGLDDFLPKPVSIDKMKASILTAAREINA